MTFHEFQYTVQYLNEKKVPFAVKCNYQDMTVSLIGVNVQKAGKFWRVNGKIIATNFINNVKQMMNGFSVTQEQIELF